MNKKHSFKIEYIGVVVIGILLITAALQLIVYEFNAMAAGQQKQDYVGIADMLIYQSDPETSFAKFHEEYLLPEIIAYTAGAGVPRAFMYDTDALIGIYGDTRPYLNAVLYSGASCTLLGDTRGRVIWEDCLASSNYVYLRYRNEFAFPLIYAYANPELSISSSSVASGDMAKISELFIRVCRETEAELQAGLSGYAGKYYAVARSADGKTALFISDVDEADLSFNTSEFNSYTDYVESKSFNFYGALGDNSLGNFARKLKIITPSSSFMVLLPEESVSVPNIHISKRSKDVLFGDGEDREMANALLSIFEFDTEHAKEYTEGAFSRSYVSGSYTFSLDAQTLHYSSGSDAGINIGTYLKYGILGEDYSVFDAVKACDALLSQLHILSPVLFGGNAEFGLWDVFYDDGVLCVEYCYCYENVSISDYKIRFFIKENAISSVQIPLLSVQRAEGTALCDSPIFAAVAAEYALDEDTVKQFGSVLDNWGGSGVRPVGNMALEYAGDGDERAPAWKFVIAAR